MSSFKDSLNELKSMGVSVHELGKLNKLYNSKSEQDKKVYDKYAHLFVERHVLNLDKITQDLNSVNSNLKTIKYILFFFLVALALGIIFTILF